MAYDKVIVFGATGGVGSNAAVTAHQLGSKVVLALRDPKKPVPLLSAEQEKAGGFERVQADLTQPETLTAAVKQTGAKAAFIYLAFTSPDHQRSSLEALKAAGVEWVVFLSSFTVQGHGDAVRSITKETGFIPFAHAAVEVSLQDVYGKGHYAAIRPAFFATNLYGYKDALRESDTPQIPAPKAQYDFIAPEDMGRVAGTLLAQGPAALTDGGKNELYLAGPQLITQADALALIGKALGRDVQVRDFDTTEDALRSFMKSAPHLPEFAARQLVEGHYKAAERLPLYDIHEEAVANIKKYGGGKPATTFQQWVEAHAADF